MNETEMYENRNEWYSLVTLRKTDEITANLV